ncbi:MAG TPA: hypothetical protein VIH42_14400, partial [Thermoguttaceae bacterium]
MNGFALLILLIAAFVLLLLSRKHRMIGVIGASLLITIMIGPVLMDWNSSKTSNTELMAQWQEGVQIPTIKLPQIPEIQSPVIQLEEVGPYKVSSSRATWFSFALLAVLGLTLVGGLLLGLVMLSHPKTRGAGIAVLVVIPVFFLLISMGVFPFVWRQSQVQPQFLETRWDAQRITEQVAGDNQQALEARLNAQKIVAEAARITRETLAKKASLNTNPNSPSPYSIPGIPSPELVKEIERIVAVESARMVNSIGQAVARTMAQGMKDHSADDAAKPTSAPANSSLAATGQANPAPPNPSGPAKAVQAPTQPALTSTTGAQLPATNNSADNKSSVDILLDNNEHDKAAQAHPSTERPDWVDKPPQLVGDEYQMCVASGPYLSRMECKAKIPDALQNALDQYMEIYPRHQSVDRIVLPPEKLQHLLAEQWEETRQYTVGTNTQASMT